MRTRRDTLHRQWRDAWHTADLDSDRPAVRLRNLTLEPGLLLHQSCVQPRRATLAQSVRVTSRRRANSKIMDARTDNFTRPTGV